MSYPQQFDSNRFDNSSGSRPNTVIRMPNNSYAGQMTDPFQAQSFAGIPAPIPYSNTNPNPNSLCPANMFFPPVDFSVPPPIFPPINVSIP